MRRAVNAWACSILLSLGYGAMAAAQALPALDDYQIRAFGPANGLLAAEVRGLAQTGDGYLYVASARGLARHDGIRFQRVPLPGFSSAVLQWIWKDAQDRLWLLTGDNELGYVRQGIVHRLPPPPATLRGMSQTGDGTLWLGGFHGLVRVRADSASPYTHFTAAHGLPSDSVRGVYDHPDGRRILVGLNWIAALDADASRAHGVRVTPIAAGLTQVAAIRANPRGLWLAFREGVRRLEKDQLLLPGAAPRDLRFDIFAPYRGREAFLPDEFARFIPLGTNPSAPPALRDKVTAHTLTASDGTRWVALRDADDGGYELARYADSVVERIALRDRSDFRTIHHLMEDHERNIWIGTDQALFQISPRKVATLLRRHGLSELFTTAVVQTRDGAVWIGTWHGGLHRYAGGRLTHRYSVDNGLPDDRIRALYEAKDGTLWVGMYRGLAAIRQERVLHQQRTPDEVGAFAESRDGRLWIGTSGRLLVRTPSGLTEHRPGFWRTVKIAVLHVASDGALWIAGENGLFRLERDSLRTFGATDGLRSPFVASISEETDGTLWIGTFAHGLHRYRGGVFVPVTTRDGLHGDGVWRMLEDGLGGLWLSGDYGIARVDRDRLHAVADARARGEQPPAPLAPLVFAEAEGLPNRESNRAFPAGWRTRSGRLLFNNIGGIAVIDPRRATEAAPPPRVVLHRVIADGQALNATATSVPAGTRQLAVEFAALSFAAPDQNRYRYRLDGYDDTWVDGGFQERAAYTNLPPGRYTLRVQAASGLGEWGEPGLSYSFVLHTLVWQTWWFRVAVLASALPLLAIAYRYRVRRLLEVERLRLRIAADLHDDVGSNLSSIALLSEMLRDSPRVSDVEQRQLKRIHDAARETMGALREIIWLVDPRHGCLPDLVKRMRSVADDMLHGIPHTFSASEPLDPRPLDITFMRNTFLVFKEALHNLVRHAAATQVTIRLRETQGRFVLQVDDNGMGFDQHAISGGRGIENMRQRAHQAGGSLMITSHPGRGTRITYEASIAQTRDGARSRAS